MATDDPTSSLPLPNIHLPELSDEEARFAAAISSAMMLMNIFVRDFAWTLDLFDFAGEKLSDARAKRPTGISVRPAAFHAWQVIAARDGAITIYHFKMAMDGIRAELRNCPPVRALANISKLREADAAFRARFPRVRTIRHGVAHKAEVMRNPTTMERHMSPILDPESGNLLGHRLQFDAVTDRSYSTTWDGASVAYEVNQESLNTLIGVRALFFSAFSGAK